MNARCFGLMALPLLSTMWMSTSGCSEDTSDEPFDSGEAAIGAGCARLSPANISASGTDGANIAANVNDNNVGTRWSGPGKGAFIQFDLGGSKTLCEVRIAWHRGNERVNHFVIAASQDGAKFTALYSGDSS